MAAWYVTEKITFKASSPRDFKLVTIRNYSGRDMTYYIDRIAFEYFHVMSQLGEGNYEGGPVPAHQSAKFLVGRTENSFPPGVNVSQIMIWIRYDDDPPGAFYQEFVEIHYDRDQ